MSGDTVAVHTGIYREWVNPFFGGIDDSRRILYRAAEGEVAQIKGSEPVSNWKKGKDGVWTAVIPNTCFGNFNPFLQLIEGDWFDNHGRDHHTAEVYLIVSLYEVTGYEQVVNPEPLKSRRASTPRVKASTTYPSGDSESARRRHNGVPLPQSR